MKVTYLETKNLASQFARPNPLMDSYVTFGQYTQTKTKKWNERPQLSVTYLNGESQKVFVEIFRATSQNVQSPFVSRLLKPINCKLHSTRKTTK